MKKLLLIPLLLLPATVYATTYEWVDSKGTVNFTEDLGKVPKKYRKKVRVIGDETGAPQITETTESTGKGAPVTKASERQPERKTLYGGKDEKTWRADFAQARGELKVAEQDVREIGTRMKDISKMSRTEYLTLQNSLRQDEARMQGKRKRLDELTAEADAAGVPADFRQ
ncbi:DUF4124 domain-containing protein [Geomesophilobacter sediminis]|uniref:DUF4124 domain-containing protein n=1 Tax=Geomesophilobacter sediminis TaxID=2798584 RepID=A0A8J7M2T4_9BACT|nr:DUF4124 domain-containing protein [Geomesophilobacter sediminis]MBJ6727479.1 DUF4124 domain-containing protein [Geomesophilobacter sediminis]